MILISKNLPFRIYGLANVRDVSLFSREGEGHYFWGERVIIFFLSLSGGGSQFFSRFFRGGS